MAIHSIVSHMTNSIQRDLLKQTTGNQDTLRPFVAATNGLEVQENMCVCLSDVIDVEPRS